MLSFIGRRKILRLYKARATNKKVIKPSRDAKSCVSQTNVPQTDVKQYATYNDFPCVSQAAVPQTDGKQYASYHDSPCVSQAGMTQTDALRYTAYKYVFTPRETQNLASLQG